MMKLALIRTVSEKEDPELHLLLTDSASDNSPHECSSKVEWQTNLSIHCSEETVWVRPSWSNCGKETNTLEEQQTEKTCLGQESQGMDIRSVEN